MRRRRILTAKHGFTAWAIAVYAFLYLPILVVVIFAFDKPSPDGVADVQGLEHLQHRRPPTSATSRSGTASRRAGSRRVSTPASTRRRSRRASSSRSRRRSSPRSSGSAAALALARMRRRWRAPFDILVYLTLVVPEIVIAVASLIFFVQVRNNFGAFPPLGQVDHPARTGRVQRLARHAHHPGAVRRDGRQARGGRVRPRLGPGVHVPPGDAPAPDAGRHLGTAALVHVLVRRLRASELHERHHVDVADRALLGRSVRDHTRGERAGNAHAARDPRPHRRRRDHPAAEPRRRGRARRSRVSARRSGSARHTPRAGRRRPRRSATACSHGPRIRAWRPSSDHGAATRSRGPRDTRARRSRRPPRSSRPSGGRRSTSARVSETASQAPSYVWMHLSPSMTGRRAAYALR